MSTSFPVVVERKSNQSTTELLLDVQNVSKLYHLWESPRARLVYGLWSQVPGWAPFPLRRMAEAQKAKSGHDFYALHDVSLQLRRGESLAILGRNGSGKSTLLQIICGTLRQSEGVVTRNCQRITALLELGSGFNPEFTGRENVYLNGAVLGLNKDEIAAKFDRILEFAEIGQFIDQPVKTYSSGMLVRLAFAVQVQLDPELLIVDEALAVGDVFFQQKCFTYMRQLKERGCSFLIVSHDFAAIQQFCDRGIVLIDGRKHFEGITREAIREYRLTEKLHHPRGSQAVQTGDRQETVADYDEFEGPEGWFEPEGEVQTKDMPVKLIRWSCTNEAGKIVDHFSPNQGICLFADFQCFVSVREASVGFGIRDRTGQMIQGKHLYQIRPESKVTSTSPFILRCEFSFFCRLNPGEYTIEFGFVDIHRRETPDGEGYSDKVVDESFEILYSQPPVGRFVVSAKGIDPIRRKGHFGIVDIDAEVRFTARESNP
jgi:lipopolysaccharide transport system ATP-binding protein